MPRTAYRCVICHQRRLEAIVHGYTHDGDRVCQSCMRGFADLDARDEERRSLQGYDADAIAESF